MIKDKLLKSERQASNVPSTIYRSMVLGSCSASPNLTFLFWTIIAFPWFQAVGVTLDH